MLLTEFERSILIAIAAGFSSGILAGIMDYTFVFFVQRNWKINLKELALKSIFFGVSMAVILVIVVVIEINFSSSILSISQINNSTIFLAILLPLMNFVIEKFLGMIASQKAK